MRRSNSAKAPSSNAAADGLSIDPQAAPSSPFMSHEYIGHYNLLSPTSKTRTVRLLNCFESLWGGLFPLPQPAPSTAHALALDAWSRATIGMSSVFMGPALLELATASCPADQDIENCIVHGFRPSSILTNLAAVSGLLGSILLPLFGACIDHTPHRRFVGYTTALVLVLIQAVQIGVGRLWMSWFTVVSLQLVAAILYNLHLTATLAYIPELTTVAIPSSPISTTHRQAAYNAAFGLLLYVSTLIFLVHVLFWAQWLSDADADVGTARIAQIIATITSLVGFGLAWGFLFPERPALQEMTDHNDDDASLWTVGFIQTWRTVRTVRPTVLAVLGAIAAGEAASTGLVSVSTTYCKVVLQMDASEIGFLFLIVLFGAIPGTKLGEYVTKRFGNPLYSLIVCHLGFIVTTAIAASILKGPEDKKSAYGIAILWGITFGWISPQNTCALVPLVPPDQTTEWMGLFVLGTQIFSWFPPLLFTVLNEHGWDMSIGMVSLNVAFGLALLCAVAALRKYQGIVDEVNMTPPSIQLGSISSVGETELQAVVACTTPALLT